MYLSWHQDELLSPVRHIKVKLSTGNATPSGTGVYYSTDYLKEFTVTRLADKSKFFGYGITHKLNYVLSEVDGEFGIYAGDFAIVQYEFIDDYGDAVYETPFPTFYVTEVHRDKEKKTASVTAYDISYEFNKYPVSVLNLEAEHSIYDLFRAVWQYFGLFGLSGTNAPQSYKDKVSIPANFEGTETIKDALDAACEIMGSVYYIGNSDTFEFHRLNTTISPNFTITKGLYYELDVKSNRRFSRVVSTTSLGDNVEYSSGYIGSTQYLRDNPYLNNDNVATYLQELIDSLSGNTYTQYECKWRGCGWFLPFEGILIEADTGTIRVQAPNMELHYDGGFTETIYWEYEDNDEETASNPATLGEALKQTYANVDKVNKEIELVASDITATEERISSLEINTESISASVSKVEQTTTEALEGISSDIATLSASVEAKISAEDVSILIKSEIDNGTTKVVTNTGYTFDDEGLTVSKSDSEMSTTISEDGMTVYKNEEAVLVANNEGVNAVNLHATTYLIIGENSRFEDYGNRTGCFWIGG